MKLAILDKDGTLIVPKSIDIEGNRNQFVQNPTDQEQIGGIYEQLDKLVDRGYKLVIASNQGGVAAGHKTLIDAIAEMVFCLRLYPQIDYAVFCPDFEGVRLMEVYRLRSGDPLRMTLLHGDHRIFQMPDNCDDFGAIHRLVIEDDERVVDFPGNFDKTKIVGKCRKPNGGMLEFAMLKEQISRDQTIMIGDRPEDKAAAAAAEVKYFDVFDRWNIESA